ncbi:MAG: hypothetical protein ACKO91_10915 [Acidimicrobiales bacterium]
MTKLLLVVIAVMWIVVLVPPLLRSRSDARPGDSIVSFRRQLTTLQRSAPFAGRPSGGHVTVGQGSARPLSAAPSARAMAQPVGDPRATLARYAARRRRQSVLLLLAGSCLATAVIAGSLYSPTWWYLNFLLDAVLAGYVYLLVRIRKDEQARSRRLPERSWSRAA